MLTMCKLGCGVVQIVILCAHILARAEKEGLFIFLSLPHYLVLIKVGAQRITDQVCLTGMLLFLICLFHVMPPGCAHCVRVEDIAQQVGSLVTLRET